MEQAKSRDFFYISAKSRRVNFFFTPIRYRRSIVAYTAPASTARGIGSHLAGVGCCASPLKLGGFPQNKQILPDQFRETSLIDSGSRSAVATAHAALMENGSFRKEWAIRNASADKAVVKAKGSGTISGNAGIHSTIFSGAF